MPKTAKRLLGALAIAGALLVALALAVPLVLRGPRLAWAVERGTRSFCGTIRVDGGRFAVTAVFDLLLGRGTPVVIEGLRVVAPDGEEVLAAGRLDARLRASLDPLRLDVDDLRLASVHWRFVEHPDKGRVDFIDVFAPVPAGGRAQCVAPAARPAPGARPVPHAVSPRKPPRAGVVEVHHAVLADVDLRLDFAMWGLDLRGTSAEGAVGFESGGAEPRLHFQVHGIDASRGGSLRVGRHGQRWTAETPFDRVRIDRFSTLDDAPADMLLEVGSATTERSTLSGRARFTDIFPWGRRSRWPGMDLDARWTAAGDVVEHVKESWGLTHRFPGRIDGDLSARLRGPFVRLAGQLQARGPHAQFDVDLASDQRLDARLRLDRIETDGVLDPALAPVLAGRLSGQLHAHVQVGRNMHATTAAIDEAALLLERSRGGPWPARLRVTTHEDAGASTPDELSLFLGGAHLADGTLTVRQLRASVAGSAVTGALSAVLFDHRGEPLPAPRLDGRAEVRGLVLDEFVPGGLVRGRVSARAELHGPSDALRFLARLPAGASLQLWTQPLALPRRIEARLRGGDRLTVLPLRLGDPASGAIDVGGTANFNGPVDAHLALLRYPIARLLAATGLPISGRIDSGLHLTGPTRQPRVAGQLAFTDVRVGQVRLGDGAVTLTPRGRDTAIDGRLIPAVGIAGRLVPGPRPSLTASLDLDRLPLAPFAARVPGLSGEISGDVQAGADLRHVTAAAELRDVVIAYQRASLKLRLHNTELIKLALSERSADLSPAHLRGDGVDLDLDAHWAPTGLSARLEAQLALPAFGAALRPWIKETAGVLAVEAFATGKLAAPALTGTITVLQPLRLWPVMLLAPVQVPSGVVAFRGPQLEARALTLSLGGAVAQIDGRAALAPSWSDVALDARVSGGVDGATLARRLPALLTGGRGRIAVEGQVGGTAGAPTFDGHADFLGFGARVPDAPIELRTLDGRIEAHGHTLSTSGLVLALEPAGRLQIGTPEAPARIDVTALRPPEVGTIAVGLRGHDLATGSPISGLRLGDVDLQLALDQGLGGPLRIGGDVWIDGASLAVSRGGSGGAASAALKKEARVARELFPDIWLDVGVHSRPGALAVQVPVLPDLSLTLDCRVTGSYRHPRARGRLQGDGAYSRLALWLYDVFADKHVRRCGEK